jgi:hypothetical protein
MIWVGHVSRKGSRDMYVPFGGKNLKEKGHLKDLQMMKDNINIDLTD